LRGPRISGVAEGRHGLIPTDAEMRVEGADRVWAAGDATWFPLKQGGIAAQQADVAAAAILREAGLDVDVPAFAPVVRGALLTGSEPLFFSSANGEREGASTAPLWWPPGKVAGRWLAPYLAREWSGGPDDPLIPLEDRGGDDPEQRAGSHREALDLALRFADVDAEEGEFANAVRWLDLAERLNLTLPPAWARKRSHWREILQGKP
jgi:sulfide:quinone oxidoreductase